MHRILLPIILLFGAKTFAQPTITSFTPATGSVGTLVTITGTNLSSPTAFTIGGVKVIAVSNTGTQLVGMVMPGAVTGTVSVTTAGGTATSLGNFTITPTLYPSVQEGGKLVGTGNTGSANQGNSVSLSADGNTAIVGGDFDNNYQGAFWVFTRSGGVWSQQGTKLFSTGNIGQAYQGFSVSLSADGNTVIVGGDFDNNRQGAAWVYTRSAGVWSQQGNKLVGSGNIGAAWQGFSVSLSADGNTAIVGGPADNNNVGAFWVYTRSAGVWSQQGSKVVGTGNTGAASQSWSVALSADGNTAIVGGITDNNNQGAVWVFTSSAGVWSQQGGKLVGSGNIGAAWQGVSVSMSADGNTAIAGGYDDNNYIGATWVFTRSNGVWSQQGAKLVGSGSIIGVSGVSQGSSVSLSADGNTAIVGGDGDNSYQGAAWVFTRSGGVWSQQGGKLVGTGVRVQAAQGSSVSLSADGNTAIVGGDGDNSGLGAAWVFIQSGALPLNFLGLAATQKTLGIQLDWKVANESGVDHYEAERSLNGTTFSKINNNISAIGSSSYSLLDPAPNKGVDFYRIKAVDVSGAERYTDIVKVILGAARGVTISPNPVSGRHISLQFSNEPAGAYSINIMNVARQLVYHTTLNHQGGNTTKGVDLPSRIARGIYLIQIAMPDNSNDVQQIIIGN